MKPNIQLDEQAIKALRRERIDGNFMKFVKNYYVSKNPEMYDVDGDEAYHINWFISEMHSYGKDKLRQIVEKQFGSYKYIDESMFEITEIENVLTGLLNSQYFLISNNEEELTANEVLCRDITAMIADFGITEKFHINSKTGDFFAMEVVNKEQTMQRYEAIAREVRNAACKVAFQLRNYVMKEGISRKIQEEKQLDIKALCIDYLCGLEQLRKAA